MVQVTKIVTITIDGDDIHTLTDIFELARVRIADVGGNAARMGLTEQQRRAIMVMLARVFDSA